MNSSKVSNSAGQIDVLLEKIEATKGPEQLRLLEKLVELKVNIRDHGVVDQLLRGITIAESLNDRVATVSLYIRLAEVQITFLSEYDDSLASAQKALNMLVDSDDNAIKSKAHTCLGAAHFYLGEYDEALNLYGKSLDFLELIAPRTNDVKLRIAKMYRRMSTVFNTEKDNHHRKFYLEKALEIFTELEDTRGLAQVYLSLGGYYYYESDYRKCIEYQLKALPLRKELNDLPGEAYSYRNMGHCYSKLGEFELAEKYLFKSLEIDDQINEPFTKLATLTYLGECFHDEENWVEALLYLEKAERLGLELNAKEKLLDIYQFLSSCHEKLCDFEKALTSAKQYFKYFNTALNVDKSLVETEMRVRGQIEQKEAETAFHANQVAEVREYAERLENMNEELRQFAHVASHDLKEPLRMISNYLEIIKLEIGETMPIDYCEYLEIAIA